MERDDVAVIGTTATWNLSAAALLVGAAVSFSACADSLPAVKMPEASKGIGHAAGECRRQDAAGATQLASHKSAVVEPDLSCAIDTANLSKLIGSRDTVIVDVRPEAEYARFHIAGALNLTASGILGKSFLRSKTLVLIGNGKGAREQYTACRRLKARGFSRVRVLRGGMFSWLVSGQPTLGQRLPGIATMAWLTPLELWTESRFAGNLVLAVRQHDAIRALFPDSLPAADNNIQTLNKAITLRKRNKKTQPTAVVLVADKDLSSDQVMRLSQALQPLPLLVFKDSTESLQRQMVQQEAIWTAYARGPKHPPGCGH